MNEIQSNVPRNQNWGACCHGWICERSTMYIESGQDP